MTPETPSTFSPDDLRVPGEVAFYAARGSIRQPVGQQWCRTDRWSWDRAIISVPPAGYLVLCDVYRDTVTGALTYEPALIESLPRLDAPPDRPVDSLK